jgi:hypothetical protein
LPQVSLPPRTCFLPHHTTSKMGIDIPCFPSSRYTRVADEEDGSIHKEDHNRWSLAYIGRFLLILLVTILAICGWIYWVSKARTCGKEAVRIEWRGLTTPQKHDYIAAVQCLKTRPSRIGMNHTLYDDFPFVHSHFGEYGMSCQTPDCRRQARAKRYST